MNKWLILSWLITAAQLAQAQDFRISRIDESGFPEISFNLEISGGNDKTIDNFAIEELSQKVEFSVENLTGQAVVPTSHTYIFLVENSYYFYRNNIYPEIISALKQITGAADADDYVNILFFDGKTPHTVKYISAEPTSNTALLNQMTDCYLLPETDSVNFDNPLYASIEQAAAYTLEHTTSKNAKFLTIISRGLNLSNTLTFSKDFLEAMHNSDTYVNAVMFKTETPNARRELTELCEASGGSFSVFEKGQLEQTLMQLAEKISKTPPKTTNHYYKITFETSQNGTNNVARALLGNKEIIVEFSNPGKTGIFGRHPSTAIAGIMFVVLAVVLIIYAMVRNKVLKKIDESTLQKMREIQIQNKRLRREIEKYRKHPVSVIHSFDDFNSDENLVAGGQQSPKLIIDNDGEHTAFDLNKLVMSIGRSADNDIVIPNRTVSSHHAVLSFEGGIFFITDKDSTNGVFVNDIRINKSKVHNSDIIRIGAVFAKLKY